MFIQYIHEGRLKDSNDIFLSERVSSLQEVLSKNKISEKEILEHLRFNYQIADARKTIYKDNYFDLIHSNNTLEHIEPLILKDILNEFKRIQKEESVLSHFIDLSDHFAHYDNSITIYNFLRFSDNQWKIIDNSLQPQNRMRLTDYKALYDSLGIKFEITELREGDVKVLQSVSINKKYKDYSMNELAVSHCQFISKKQNY
jgi:ubiquinone/menaquinone biosynthesis C-methylase UbiE